METTQTPSTTPAGPAGAPPKSSSRRRRLRVILLIAAAVGLPIGGYAVYLQATTNFHAIIEGKAYRSAQPNPQQVKDWIGKYGIKTVMNLRGDDEPAAAGEAQAVREAGAAYVNHRAAAESLPTTIWFADVIRTLETAQTPLLLHCKAGADRSGVASVMAAMAIGGRSYDQAREQLSLKYGHFHFYNKIGKVLDQYEAYRAGLPGSPGNGGWAEFRQWALEVYHPLYYFVQISVPPQVDAKAGQPVTVEVEIKNLSDKPLPAGREPIQLACFIGSSIAQRPDRELGQRLRLPAGDIAPQGGNIKVSYEIKPQAAGEYEVHFDLVEEGKTWFAKQGSPVPTMKLVVRP